jgi:hypothetical protein
MRKSSLPPARASSIHRTVACPGWRWAEVRFPSPPADGDTGMRDSGTAIHEAIDYVIDGSTETVPLDRFEEWIKDRCLEILETNTARYFSKPIKKLWVKEKLEWRDSATSAVILSGTPDYFATDGDGLWLVNDNKCGPKPVAKAALNWQVQAYMALILKNAKRYESFGPITEFIGIIAQPLVSRRAEPTSMSVDMLQRLARRIEDAIAMSELEDAPRIPGSHCEYCPARSRCPEAAAVMPYMAARLTGKEAIRHLTIEEMVQLRPRVDALKGMIDEFDRAFKGAVVGGLVQSWEPWHRAAGHTVKDPLELFNLVREWVTNAEFRGCVKVSVPQVRDLVAAKMSASTGITKADAIKWWEAEVLPKLTELPKQLMIRERKG